LVRNLDGEEDIEIIGGSAEIRLFRGGARFEEEAEENG
jgi:hypothetical protein